MVEVIDISTEENMVVRTLRDNIDAALERLQKDQQKYFAYKRELKDKYGLDCEDFVVSNGSILC